MTADLAGMHERGFTACELDDDTFAATLVLGGQGDAGDPAFEDLTVFDKNARTLRLRRLTIRLTIVL